MDSEHRPAWEVLSDYAQRYGEDGLVQFWLMGAPQVLVTDPDLVSQVLVNNSDTYCSKKDPIAAMLPVLGTKAPFLAADRQAWGPRIRRTLLTTVVLPDLHRRLGTQVAVLREHFNQAITR